ncbi:MAG: LytTR family DNA-binding domain-containing protein [Bacteroidota bacterium]
MEISCIIIDDESHAIAELSSLIARIPSIYLVKSFISVYDAVDFLSEGNYVDIIFSDIEMPMLNGILAAKILHTYCDYLIYVTAHRDFAFDAYGVKATGYLLKPVSIEALIAQVSDIANNFEKQAEQNMQEIIFIKGDHKNSFTKLEFKDIIYVEALLNYIKICTVKGDEVTYLGLKNVEGILKRKTHFFRISKSIIINTEFIDKVDGNIVKLLNKNCFTTGEKYRNAFHDFLRKRTLNP